MIKKAIVHAIKARRWLKIEYENRNNEITNYWIAIQDIDIDNQRLIVNAFNMTKVTNESSGLIDTTISFNQIKEAQVIHNTTYHQSPVLIDKIESNLEALSWLEFDTYSENTLNYIYDCIVHEEPPYQKETALLRQIDQATLEKLGKDGKYLLSIEQMADLVPKLERLSIQYEKNIYEISTLAINYLSILTKKGLYVVAYKELAFNPYEKSLIASSEILFNYSFASDKNDYFRHHLKNYLDIETDDFLELFVSDPMKAKALLEPEVLKFRETLDERPYIMDMVRYYYGHIEREIDQIKVRKKNQDLSTPLKAFFGNMTGSLVNKRTRNVSIVLNDNAMNIDQLRVVYNALTRPITYVQGPPGTGKTHTIVSTLISSFFNEDKVLVSSNNNKPIDDIYQKITNIKSRDRDMFLPFIRLGNQEETLKSLNYIKSILPRIQKYYIQEEKLELSAKVSANQTKEINQILVDYEQYIDLEEELNTLRDLQENLNLQLRGLAIQELIAQKEKEFSLCHKADDDSIKQYLQKIDDRFLNWLFFTGIKHYRRLLEPKNKSLYEILHIEDDDARIKEFNLYLKDDANFANFQKIFPIILTTNQSAHRLGTQQEHFDLVIIDEAGQCSIGYSLFPLARGKRLLLVGDLNQLRPVTGIALENNKYLMKRHQVGDGYNYIENSILSTLQKFDTISKFVLLRYHYRSHRDIINFSNIKYYNSQLKLRHDHPLESKALEHIHVNTQLQSKPFDKNTSLSEIDSIIQNIKENNYQNVGVITPFRNQADLIASALKNEKLDHVDVGTVHTFQGDEKDVIYLSCGITKHTFDKTYHWLKNNQELINVATTRARNKFIFVSDENEVKKRSPSTNDLYELLQYVKQNGKDVALKESAQFSFINGANYKNYDTKKEKEFFDTINHLLTTADRYVLASKVRIQSILTKFETQIEYDYGLKGEFDLVIFKKLEHNQIPVVIIELDGQEHKDDEKVIRRDAIKQRICEANKVKLIRIDNQYSRRYLYIKDLLQDILK